ncbi:MAG: ASKHA domain-containing protein, partial [Anaerolineales bacterium]
MVEEQRTPLHTLILMPSGRHGSVAEGTTLLEAARTLGVELESICGGRQTCNKCLVRIENGYFDKHKIESSEAHVSPPTQKELQLLEELGIDDLRMSCNTQVMGDLLVTVPEESQAQKQIIRKTVGEQVIEVKPIVRQVYIEVDQAELGEHRGDWGRIQSALKDQWDLENLLIAPYALRHLQRALREGDWKVTAVIWDEQQVLDLQPGYQEGAYGLAVDIGSTTVAAYLCDLRTGAVLSTASAMNPQVSYGEDLMSRISYTTTHPNGLRTLHTEVIDVINRLAAQAARDAKVSKRAIYEMVSVGNTTMTHIFLNIPPKELGEAPFALANRDSYDVKARDLGLRLHPEANVHVVPSQAGHVGADNVGVLLAEEPFLKDKIVLTIDIGTNAEIVLSSKDWMYSASSPTGPAFEGGQISSGMRAAPGAI